MSPAQPHILTHSLTCSSKMNDGVLTKTLIWKSYISYVSNMASYILRRRVPVVDMDHRRCEDTVYRLGV